MNTAPPRERERLPVIQRLAGAYKLWHECLPHVPKTARYTLGDKIDRLFVAVIEATVIAGFSAREQKLPFIRKAAVELDVLKFFLQIAWEIKALDTKKYIALSEKFDEVGRMLGGWVK